VPFFNELASKKHPSFFKNKYSKFKAEIKADYEKIKVPALNYSIHEIAVKKCDYYLSDKVKYRAIC